MVRRILDVKMVFIKYANPEISKVLRDLINVCLSERTYPDFHKIFEVVSIFKKDESNNYRSISLL